MTDQKAVSLIYNLNGIIYFNLLGLDVVSSEAKGLFCLTP